MAAPPPDVQRHTGADFEAGRVHRHHRNEEQPYRQQGRVTHGKCRQHTLRGLLLGVRISHRKKIDDVVVKKAVFVLSNYGLLHHTVEMGDGLSDFGGLMLMDKEAADEVQWRRLHALQRGQLLTDDELLLEADPQGEMSGTTAEADVDEEGEGEGEDALAAAADQREIKWGLLPEGLTVAPKPASLDDSLKGKLIYSCAGHRHMAGCWVPSPRSFTSASPRLFANLICESSGLTAGRTTSSSWITMTQGLLLPTIAGCCWIKWHPEYERVASARRWPVEPVRNFCVCECQ